MCPSETTGQVTCVRKWGNVLWIPRVAGLIEHVDQCVLAVGLQRQVKVNRGALGLVAQVLPVL